MVIESPTQHQIRFNDTSIIDEHIETTEFFFDPLKCEQQLGFVGYITFSCNNFATRSGRNFRHQCLWTEWKEWSFIRKSNYCVNRKCKTTKSVVPKIWSSSPQRNASKIIKLVNWSYWNICTHFDCIDTSSQSNHNHASIGQCFCYDCTDASTWACHHCHFPMPFIHLWSACSWLHNSQCTLARPYGARNKCFFLWFRLILPCWWWYCCCCFLLASHTTRPNCKVIYSLQHSTKD